MTHKYYTLEEEEFIRNNYDKMTAAELGEVLNRSKSSIYEKVQELGLSKRPKKYKGDELPYYVFQNDIEVIKKLGGKISDRELYEKHLPHFPSRKAVTRVRNKFLKIPPFRVKMHEQEKEFNGYLVYKGKKVHRTVVEKKLGRKLKKGQPTHHLDGNRYNNDGSNLYACKSAKEHSQIHISLQKCMFELVRDGYVLFNKLTGLYELNSERFDDEGNLINHSH